MVEPDVSAPNPLNASVRILVWIYRIGVWVTLIGWIAYLVQLGRATRAVEPPVREDTSL